LILSYYIKIKKHTGKSLKKVRLMYFGGKMDLDQWWKQLDSFAKEQLYEYWEGKAQ